MNRRVKRRIRIINIFIFFAGAALMAAGDYLDSRWLPVVAGVLMSWPVCFILWDYKPKDDRD